MHPDIETLLALQADDEVIRGLESKLAGLEPRLHALEGERGAAEAHLRRAQESLAAEEHRLSEVQRRLTEHRQLHERSVALLDTVRTQREAAAAMSQVEQVNRFVNEEQATVDGIQRRMAELRQAAEAHEATLTEIAGRQESDRAAIAEERREIEEELRLARMKRDGAARRVPRSLLTRYDRINARRGDHAVFALHGASCGNCDTVIPLQRRSQMQRSGAIEMCEACGVLLYVGDQVAS